MRTFSNLSNEKYHEHGTDYISSSFVKNVQKHSIAKALLPLSASQALIFGDAMHTYFEDRTEFHSRFVTFDDTKIIADIMEARPDLIAPTMTKDYKTYRNEFEKGVDQDQTILSLDDVEKIQNMYDNTIKNEAVKSIPEMYDYDAVWDEYSFFTDHNFDKFSPLKFRVRPDKMLVKNETPMAIIDWKSCKDASKEAFRSDFFRYRYDIQAAFYCMVLGLDFTDFYFVAIEKEYPYNSAVYTLSEETHSKACNDMTNTLIQIMDWVNDPRTANTGIVNKNTITQL
mgnify:CR=1 FL=1|tara:strand:+ start:4362 stop:5213 length:852 start_codon:yes stop_codon:yes gene_type:complete